MKKLAIAGTLMILVLGSYAFVHSYEHEPKDINTLTFSNTQTWNPDYLNTTTNPSEFTALALSQIQLPPPPANNSEETKQELRAMHDMVALRTPEKLAEINDELSIQTTRFGSSTIGELADKQRRPYTAELITTTMDLSGPFIFSFKKQFDRVRASYLDPTLSTALEVPGHPAYPSGHATQSMLLALLLGKLDPVHEDDYFQSALRIAYNREIAGFHYPSDSKAGQELARQLFPMLLKDPSYAELFGRAQQEW